MIIKRDGPGAAHYMTLVAGVMLALIPVLPARAAADKPSSTELRLQNKLSAAERELSSAIAQLDDCEKKVAALSSERVKLKSQIEYLEDRWRKIESDPRFQKGPDQLSQELRERVETLEKERAQLESSASRREQDLQAEIAKWRKRLDEAEADHEQREKKLKNDWSEKLERTNSKHAKEIAALRADIGELETEIDEAKQRHSENTDQLNIEWSKKVQTLERELNDRLEQSESEKQDLQDELDALEGQAGVEDLQKSHEAERKKLKAQIERLEEHAGNLEAQLESLKDSEAKSAGMLQERIDTLERENERLEKEVRDLGKHDKSAEQVERLNSLISKLERENSSLKGDLARLNGIVERQKKEMAELAEQPEPEPETVDPRLRTAQVLFEKGSLNKAQDLFVEVIKSDPANLEGQLGLAYCYYKRNLFSEALRLSEQIAERYADNPEVYRLKGLAAWRCGDLNLSGQAFERAIDLSPESAELHNYLGVVKFSQGDYETARRHFVLAVELDDKLVEANYNLAVLYSTPEKNDLEQAQKYYERSIQLGRKKNESLERKIYR